MDGLDADRGLILKVLFGLQGGPRRTVRLKGLCGHFETYSLGFDDFLSFNVFVSIPVSSYLVSSPVLGASTAMGMAESPSSGVHSLRNDGVK